MNATTTTPLVCLAACLLGIGAGFAVAVVITPSSPSRAAPVAAAPSPGVDGVTAELVASIAELRHEIRSLRLAVDDRPRPAPRVASSGATEADDPAEPLDPRSVDALAAAIDRLERRLSSAPGGAGAELAGELPAWLAPSDPAGAPFDGVATLPGSYEELGMDGETGFSRFWQTHRFWTQRRILERYGPPDGARATTAGVVWVYHRGDFYLNLEFHDRILINVY